MKCFCIKKWLCLSAALNISMGLALGEDGMASKPPSIQAEQNPLTLDRLVELALTHSPELQVSKERVLAAGGRAKQSGLWSNPELELTSEDWAVNRDGISQAQNLVGVSQTIPYPGKKKLDLKIGSTATQAVASEANLAQCELIRDVKVAFYKVLGAERVVAVSESLVRVAEGAAESARKRVEAGAAPDQELLRAEIPLEQARSELSGCRRELAMARQILARVAGVPGICEAPVAGKLEETADASLLKQTPGQWLQKHPGMSAARLAGERARLELKRTRLEPYPDVTAGVAGGRDGGSDNSIVQFRISLPLPIVDRSKGRKAEAQANANAAQANEAAVEQKLVSDWNQARKRLETAMEQTARYREKILPKADAALRLVETGFQEGKFGFIDWLDTQRTVAETRLAFEQKLLELNIAQAELETFVFSGDSKSNPK